MDDPIINPISTGAPEEPALPPVDHIDGAVFPREFDACPHCGCTRRFSREAMKGDFPEEQLNKRPPVVGTFQFRYRTPKGDFQLSCLIDSCVRCGTIYTVARDKTKMQKGPSLVVPNGMPNRFARRHPSPN